MTHPVYAAIQRAQALLAPPPDDLAERIVTDLHTAAAASDPAAAEIVARLQHLRERGKPADGYRAGCLVAEFLGQVTDYEVAAWARRYGRALLRATAALDDRKPEPDGDGYVWSPSTLDAVAAAVAITKPAAPLVLVPGGASRG